MSRDDIHSKLDRDSPPTRHAGEKIARASIGVGDDDIGVHGDVVGDRDVSGAEADASVHRSGEAEPIDSASDHQTDLSESDPTVSNYIARVLSMGVSVSILVLCVAVVFLLLQPISSVPPAHVLLEADAWRQPGAVLLWLTLLILGLTPLAALFALIVHSIIRRQRVEMLLSIVILLLIAVGSMLGRS